MSTPASVVQFGQDYYTLVQRISARPTGTTQIVALSACIECDAPAIVIPLAKGQAVRIVRLAALFTDAAASAKLNVQHAQFSFTVASPSTGIGGILGGGGSPGGLIATGGFGLTLPAPEVFLYNDYNELSGTNSLSIFPIADVLNTDGAAAHTVGMGSFALWELYNLQNVSGHVGYQR